MIQEVRFKTINMKEDECRWALTDLQVYRCPRCGLQLTASFSTTDVDQEPYLFCGPCLDGPKKRVLMRMVIGPEPKNG